MRLFYETWNVIGPNSPIAIGELGDSFPKLGSKVSGSDVFSSRQEIPMEVLFSLEQNFSIMYFCGAFDS